MSNDSKSSDHLHAILFREAKIILSKYEEYLRDKITSKELANKTDVALAIPAALVSLPMAAQIAARYSSFLNCKDPLNDSQNPSSVLVSSVLIKMEDWSPCLINSTRSQVLIPCSIDTLQT